MPPVYLGTKAKQEAFDNEVKQMIKGKMSGEYNQTTLGAEFGVSQPAMGKKIDKLQFSFKDMAKLFKVLNFSDEEILKVMKGV